MHWADTLDRTSLVNTNIINKIEQFDVILVLMGRLSGTGAQECGLTNQQFLQKTVLK